MEKTYTVPVKKSVIGILLDNETITYGENKDKTFEMLYIEAKSGQAVEIGCATAMFLNDDEQPKLKKGNQVWITYEERIEGETGYMKNNMFTPHDNTGFTASNVRVLS